MYYNTYCNLCSKIYVFVFLIYCLNIHIYIYISIYTCIYKCACDIVLTCYDCYDMFFGQIFFGKENSFLALLVEACEEIFEGLFSQPVPREGGFLVAPARTLGVPGQLS